MHYYYYLLYLILSKLLIPKRLNKFILISHYPIRIFVSTHIYRVNFQFLLFSFFRKLLYKYI